ncbi:LmeA family phospholipid-binding protein [Lyngbya aestuarii]|uniref:LmeA family phospholipid-binding protein n=1 Tax=Lyngbya aestuarii TaxID=118322 RepID=UPI00403E09EB
MFGGFTGTTNNSGTDWGEQMLNTVASKTIRHLFTRSESVDVSVRCHPSSKLLQGSIDSFKMSGRGLVIRRDFRTEEMSFETDAVSLDFSSVLKGRISLKQPTQAIAQVILTEPDINQAFTAELVKKRLENLANPSLLELSGGEPISFTDVQVQLQPRNRLRISAKAHLANHGLVPIGMTSTLEVERRRRILFTNSQFEADTVPESMREISQALAVALDEILNNMVDLDRFNLDGITMRINRLETQGKKLVFSGYAQIRHIPNNP